MYRHLSVRSDSLMIFLSVFGCVRIISPESILSQTWTDNIHDLSLKSYNDKNIESHPLHEGFILLSDHLKQPSKYVRPSPNNRIFKSQNSSTTTCTTVLIIKTTKRPSPSLVHHSIGHLGRRLLNKPSYDTDLDTTSLQIPTDEQERIDSFLQIDDQEFNRQLLLSESSMDGSGQMTDETTEQTSMSTPTTTTTIALDEYPTLTNNSGFILTINCTNANATIADILTELERSFGPYSDQYDVNEFQSVCSTGSERANLTLEIFTDNSTNIQTNLFRTLSQIAESKNAELFSDQKCQNTRIIRVPANSITSCYLIDLCRLCGTNPPRGQCILAYNESKCECLRENKNDSSRPYAGDFCWPSEPELIKTPSIPSRWIPVIIGILSGLTGLFCLITCCLWAMAIWRQRNKSDLQVHRLWHLPRAQISTSENVQTYLNDTISTSSSQQTESDFNLSDITDSTFFKELDQRMGENLRATITRPNTSAMLASLPSDPINELDAIIDNEDIDMIFHDPLTELFEDNELLEFVNPSLNIDS